MVSDSLPGRTPTEREFHWKDQTSKATIAPNMAESENKKPSAIGIQLASTAVLRKSQHLCERK